MTNLVEFIKSTKDEFINVAQNSDTALNFETECRFAIQQVTKNDFVYNAAKGNQQSLYNAIVNVSAVGISLNPANAHAYLVPRDGGICLDISYRGMLKLATDTGVIKWGRAQLVYENDSFIYRGPAKEPEFTSDPFAKDKGEFRGVYCIAKTVDGDILTGVMSAEEINDIKTRSKAFISAENKKKFNSPWHTDEGEMTKKTIIKREFKTWPQSNGRDRLDRAVEVLNEHEGIEFQQETLYDDDQFEQYRNCIKSEDSLGFAALNDSLDVETWSALYSSYKKAWPGTVAELKEVMNAMLTNGIDSAENIADELDGYCKSDDKPAVDEILDELTNVEREFVLSKASPNAQSWINQNLKVAA